MDCILDKRYWGYFWMLNDRGLNLGIFLTPSTQRTQEITEKVKLSNTHLIERAGEIVIGYAR